MRPSLQMQDCVDKQKEEEDSFRHVICGSLAGGFSETNKYFAAPFAKLIGKDVGYIRFFSQLEVQLACFLRSDKDE